LLGEAAFLDHLPPGELARQQHGTQPTMGSKRQYRAGIPIGFQSRSHLHYGQNAIGIPKEYQLSALGAKRPVEVKGWIGSGVPEAASQLDIAAIGCVARAIGIGATTGSAANVPHQGKVVKVG
jgi:hypothetical protein